MKKHFTIKKLKLLIAVAATSIFSFMLMSSSHREAPLIAYDPLEDNTDVYAFRDPNDAARL